MTSQNIKIYFLFVCFFFKLLQIQYFYKTSGIIQMVKDTLINKLQGTEILQKFFQLKCDLDLLSAFFSSKNRTKEVLKKFIKNKFRQTILQIQSELFRASKIKKLKLFDHSSDQMFDELSEMGNYFPKKLLYNFLIEEKTKYEKMEKSTTSSKMQIYSHVLKYAQQKDLFKYVYVENETKLENRGLKQIAKDLYNQGQLEVIYLLYIKFQADLPRITRRLAEYFENQQKFNQYHVHRNIKNLELIGLYKCIIKSVQFRGGNGNGTPWERFARDEQSYYEMMEEWNPHLKGLLIKLAVRNEIKPHHIRMVCKKVGRKFLDKTHLEIMQPPPLKEDQKICETAEIKKLKQQLLELLNTKVQFNNYCE